MVQTGLKGVRAAWEDAQDRLARQHVVEDPNRDEARDDIEAGKWEGRPYDRLPPNCPVIPLGVNGKVCYFIDTMGQVIAVAVSDWGKKLVTQLFARCPNYPYWAWPRRNATTFEINGMQADDAQACLTKAAAERGLFTMLDKVRGRGCWPVSDGGVVWHAGNTLYRVEGKRLVSSPCGEFDGVFYPTSPNVTRPWNAPVDPSDSPVHRLLADLSTWTWERPGLDPLLVLGVIGCGFLGGALPWRPHAFITGDKGVGKSTLQGVIKAIFGDSLHATADTTPAGIYQRVKQDCLPCAIDELEAGADNRRAEGVIKLATLSSSGAVMFRGGSEHAPVEFRLENTFIFSSINPPPLPAAVRSRMAYISLGKLEKNVVRRPLDVKGDVVGSMILRALMDVWPDFHPKLAAWFKLLSAAGFDQRGCDTYGTLLTVANLLLGDKALEAFGLPITDDRELGNYVARMTASDRADGEENWRMCLSHLLGSQLDAWRGGEKSTVGATIEEWEIGIEPTDKTNERLQTAGLRVQERERPDGTRERLLAVPIGASPALSKLYVGSIWQQAVWASALKQGPHDVVIRDRGQGQNVKINRQATRCLLIDLQAYDRLVASGSREEEDGE